MKVILVENYSYFYIASYNYEDQNIYLIIHGYLMPQKIVTILLFTKV